jgi:hypothetical protein
MYWLSSSGSREIKIEKIGALCQIRSSPDIHFSIGS